MIREEKLFITSDDRPFKNWIDALTHERELEQEPFHDYYFDGFNYGRNNIKDKRPRADKDKAEYIRGYNEGKTRRETLTQVIAYTDD